MSQCIASSMTSSDEYRVMYGQVINKLYCEICRGIYPESKHNFGECYTYHGCDEIEEELSQEESDFLLCDWSIKGFMCEEEYDWYVKVAAKKWYRTLSLAKRWGAKWRWDRHKKADAEWNELTKL